MENMFHDHARWPFVTDVIPKCLRGMFCGLNVFFARLYMFCKSHDVKACSFCTQQQSARFILHRGMMVTAVLPICEQPSLLDKHILWPADIVHRHFFLFVWELVGLSKYACVACLFVSVLLSPRVYSCKCLREYEQLCASSIPRLCPRA